MALARLRLPAACSRRPAVRRLRPRPNLPPPERPPRPPDDCSHRSGRRSAPVAAAAAVAAAVVTAAGPARPPAAFARGERFAGLVGPANPRPVATPRLRRAGFGDHSRQAAGLFENVRGTAAFIAGVVIPLGFFAAPKLEKDDSPRLAWHKRVHYLVATGTTCSLLTAVLFATVAVNKLAETPSPPARSVVQLIASDYELAWVGCNVNLLLGVLGFALNLVSFSLISFGPAGQVAACMVSSTLCLMVAFVNEGIARGDGMERGLRFGNDLLGLVLRYWLLLARCTAQSGSPLLMASFLLAAGALALTLRMFARRATANTDRL